MVTLPLPNFFSFFPIFLFRAAWEKGVIKAQAQNVARNLTDTPANLMTPTIFAQVSFMPTYSYIGVSFNTILQVLLVCCVHTCCTFSLIMSFFPWCPPPRFLDRKCTIFFFYSSMAFCCSSVRSFCFWGNISSCKERLTWCTTYS